MNKGKLYIVGTPIGNLKDITLRALETLKSVNIILAEDTRQTLKLLSHYDIKKRLISYHKHNEVEKIEYVKKLLDEENNIAIVSDAGMPLISDPGENLVKYLIENNYTIEVIPGVTAFTTALVKSSMDTTRFCFEGFLSTNKKQRNTKLKNIEKETRTIIFYEAPHKILQTLKDINNILGNRKICIARELTKIHEEYIYDNIVDVISKIENNPLKGEIVLLIEGMNEDLLIEENIEKLNNISNVELVIKLMKEENIDKKEAIKKVSKMKNISKNEVYKDCLDI
jgi:16S rRNA (cytidine1402-2'-O)-methyltransferase